MTQEELIQLGFDKISYSREVLDGEGYFDDPPYYFYAFTLDEVDRYDRWQEEYTKDGIELVTNTNKAFDLPDINGNGWYVEFADYENIRFYKKQDVKALIDLFKKNKKQSD